MTTSESSSELRLDSFQHVDSFAALHSLLQQSPVANAIFNESPSEIIELVVHLLPKEIQQIIRAVAVSLCPPDSGIPMVHDPLLFNREASYNTTTEVEDALPPIEFDLSLPVLRQLLNIGHRLQVLSTIALKSHIKRINNLRPQHLSKSSFVFSSYPFKKFPDGRAYTPIKTGPATWVEEYRIARALWRLQLFSLLTSTHQRLGPRIDDEAFYIECNIPLLQPEFTKLTSLWTKWEIDEILCVQDFLDETRISLRAPASTSEDPTRASTSTLSISLSSAGRLANGRYTSDMPKFQDIITVKRSTEAYNFFHRYGLRHPTSPLQRSRWEHFRRLGFGMWDQERMCSMELFRMPAVMRDKRGGRDLSIDDVAFTWKSVEEAGIPEHGYIQGSVSASPVPPSTATFGSLSTHTTSTPTGSIIGGGSEDYDATNQVSYPAQHRAVLSLTSSNGVAASPRRARSGSSNESSLSTSNASATSTTSTAPTQIHPSLASTPTLMHSQPPSQLQTLTHRPLILPHAVDLPPTTTPIAIAIALDAHNPTSDPGTMKTHPKHQAITIAAPQPLPIAVAKEPRTSKFAFLSSAYSSNNTQAPAANGASIASTRSKSKSPRLSKSFSSFEGVLPGQVPGQSLETIPPLPPATPPPPPPSTSTASPNRSTSNTSATGFLKLSIMKRGGRMKRKKKAEEQADRDSVEGGLAGGTSTRDSSVRTSTSVDLS